MTQREAGTASYAVIHQALNLPYVRQTPVDIAIHSPIRIELGHVVIGAPISILIASADEVKPITENVPMASPKNVFIGVSSLMVSLSLLLPHNQGPEE
jgi:hypothetical protein